MRCGEVEASLGIFGIEVPESDGVVEGAGDEFVFARVHGECGDWGRVPREVVEEFGFMGVKVADSVVGFGGCVYYVGLVVGEASEMGAVFLGWDWLDVFAFFCVVKLQGVVGAGYDKKFAVIVEVEGCYIDIILRGEFEAL